MARPSKLGTVPVTSAQASRRPQTRPVPRGPNSHLWQPATRKSQPRAGTASGSTPRAWTASAQTSTRSAGRGPGCARPRPRRSRPGQLHAGARVDPGEGQHPGPRAEPAADGGDQPVRGHGRRVVVEADPPHPGPGPLGPQPQRLGGGVEVVGGGDDLLAGPQAQAAVEQAQASVVLRVKASWPVSRARRGRGCRPGTRPWPSGPVGRGAGRGPPGSRRRRLGGRGGAARWPRPPVGDGRRARKRRSAACSGRSPKRA